MNNDISRPFFVQSGEGVGSPLHDVLFLGVYLIRNPRFLITFTAG